MKRSKLRGHKLRARKTIFKTAGAVAAAVAITSGLTYAALQSLPAKVPGNSIRTASANLQVSAEGINYSSSVPGFTFEGLVPGGSAVPETGHRVWLKNTGNIPLTPRLAVSSTPTNLENVDFEKVFVIVTPASGGASQSFSLQSLIAANSTGGLAIGTTQLFIGNTVQYSLKVSMAADALTGPSANINNIEFSFIGRAE